QGPKGDKGETGATGPQGPKGDKGDAGTVDTSNFYDKSEINEIVDELKNNQGNNAIIVKDIFANNELPRVYMTSDRLGLLANKQDAEATCECEIKINNQTIKCFATGKVQGTSSASYPAKNFTFKFYSDEECATKQKIDVGWGGQYKYCFKKNWVDTTHTRNLAGARIAYDMVESRPNSDFKTNLQTSPRNGAVDGFPCKLYINGEFWGLYTWNIPKDDWMFNMNSDNPNHMVLCAEKNNNGNTNVSYSTQFRKLWDGNDGTEWSIEVGTLSDTLKDSFNNAINFVMTATDEEFKNNISNYFDLYSLLDYYLFSYFTCHLDGLGKNMLMGTYDGIHWGAMLYDMDSIFGASWNGTSFVSSDYRCPSQYEETNSLLWQRIEKCFVSELKSRYFELRKGALSLGNVITHVEEIYDLVSDRVFNDDKAKWTGLPSQSTNTITRFRNYMRDRAKYVDKCINDLTEPIECAGIRLSSNSLTFTTAESKKLTYTLTPSNTTQRVYWNVSPTGIVEVDNGTIRPITRGECVLTVTCGNQSDTCNIVVDCDINSSMDGYKKVVFDGSENWEIINWTTYHNAPYGIYQLNVSNYISTDMEFPSSNTDRPTFLCSTLEPKTQYEMFNIPQEGIFGTMWQGGNLLGVSTLDVPKGNINEFKKYLAENNLVIYFKIR
ncbi:MAG: CotH kinase family protein, partial [Romboutsia timonensis]|nr:CotH kinase family protein [Romboutsia timonensis]